MTGFTPAAPAQDITSAVGFCRALISIMKLKPGGVVCAGVVCSSWVSLNRHSAVFYMIDLLGVSLETPPLRFDIEIMHAHCGASFLSFEEERVVVRKKGQWVGRYLAALSTLFQKMMNM